jgi:acetate---CoA ligase (ADP-forming)
MNEHRLTRLLSPTSVAIVGASDRSNWSHRIHGALEFIGYPGEVFYVNPKGGTAHGRPLHRSVKDIGTVPDLAYVMVPERAVLAAVTDVAEAGVSAAVVLSSGFAEVGDAGRAKQRELAELTREHDMVVLGPNALGYVNAPRRIALKPFQRGEKLLAGAIGVVSQSGNITVAIINLARSFHIGMSYMVSTGNEMDVNLGDVVDYLADDPDTRVIAVFAEAFQDPGGFVLACRKARAAGKPVVVLKVGRSEAAARSAMAHTGSLVGDDAVIDAFLHAAGAIRVTSIEDLLVTADLFAHTGPIAGDGLAVLTLSGGTADITADTAEEHGVRLPDLAPETVRRLAGVLPDYATPQNPLDVTGAATVDREMFARSLAIVTEDPDVHVALAVHELDHHAPDGEWGRESLANMVDAARTAPAPAVFVNTTVRQLSDDTRRIRTELAAPHVFGGLDRVIPAVGRIMEWHRRPLGTPEVPPPVAELPAEPVGTWSEVTARNLLARHGIPVVPGRAVADPVAAAEAAREFGGRVAIKVVSANLPHKTDAGGVALDVAPEDAESVARSLLASVPAEGLLVTPMRPPGVDLLAGVVRDPDWGCVLAGEDLVTVEVNPLRANGSTVEALDAVVVWRSRNDAHQIPS